MKILKRLLRNRDGIAAVEYVLLLALVSTGVIVGADALSTAVGAAMSDAATCVSTGVC